jgi:hypothetical protein
LQGQFCFIAAARSIFSCRSSGAALPISFDALFCSARCTSTSGRSRVTVS